LELPKEVLIELGIDKNTKYYYRGQRLRAYCRKTGLNYKAIIKIKKVYGGDLDKIVDDYKKGKYLSWYEKNKKLQQSAKLTKEQIMEKYKNVWYG
jgi:hypothetical protein